MSNLAQENCDLPCKSVILLIKNLTGRDLRDHQHPSEYVNHKRDLSTSRSDLRLDLKIKRLPKGRRKSLFSKDFSFCGRGWWNWSNPEFSNFTTCFFFPPLNWQKRSYCQRWIFDVKNQIALKEGSQIYNAKVRFTLQKCHFGDKKLDWSWSQRSPTSERICEP